MVKKTLIILGVLVVAVVLVSVFSCTSRRSASDVSDTVSGVTDSAADDATDTALDTVEKNTVKINTPYADLSVSEEFNDAAELKVRSEDPYIADFVTKADGTKLFSIHFDDKTDNFLGTLKSGDKEVELYAEFYEIEKGNAHYREYTGYQMEINTITDFLERDYGFSIGETVSDAEHDNAVYEIKTDIVTLKYPQKWEKKVTVEKGEDCVKFSAGDTPLFDLYFRDIENGTLLGTYNKTPIYIVEHEVEDAEHIAMIQDVNVIIEYLSEDNNFTIN